MKMFRTLVPVIALLAVVIAAAPAASASNLPSRHHHSNRITYHQFREYVNNHHIGPNHFTNGGRMQLNLPSVYSKDMSCDCWRATGRSNYDCPGCGTQKTPQITNPGESGTSRADLQMRNCGWCPWNWDWSGFLNDLWQGFYNALTNCLTGASSTGLGTIYTGMALSAMGYTKNAIVRMNADGMIALVVGGCIMAVVTH